jgi:hypothetical protein
MNGAFGGWLVSQQARNDWVGLLAASAAKDRGFPRRGSPHEVRLHLSQQGAEPDLFEMLDDAEAEWLRVTN